MTATFHIGRTLTRREQRLFATARANLVCIEPVGSNGALRVVGRDVHVLVAGLRYLYPDDLQPPAFASAGRDADNI